MTRDALVELREPTEFSSLRYANITRQQEWDSGNQITLTYRATELAGELGEACNIIKKLERERLGIRGSRDTVEHLAEELADIVICTDLIAMHEGIDLDAAIVAKFNATSEKVGLRTRMCLPTLSRADSEDAIHNAAVEAFKWIEAECLDIRCVSLPTGGDDADIGWEIVSHHMAPPKERVIGHGSTPLKAIQNALRQEKETI